MFSSSLAIVGRPGHTRRHANGLAELVNDEWILNHVSEGYSQVMLDAFVVAGAQAPVRIINCHSFTAEIAMVAKTDVLTVMPERMLEVPWVASSVERPLAGLELPRVQKRIIARRDVPSTPSAMHFMECLRKAYRRLGWWEE